MYFPFNKYSIIAFDPEVKVRIHVDVCQVVWVIHVLVNSYMVD